MDESDGFRMSMLAVCPMQPESTYRSSPKARIGSATRFGQPKAGIEDSGSTMNKAERVDNSVESRRHTPPAFSFGRALRAAQQVNTASSIDFLM